MSRPDHSAYYNTSSSSSSGGSRRHTSSSGSGSGSGTNSSSQEMTDDMGSSPERTSRAVSKPSKQQRPSNEQLQTAMQRRPMHSPARVPPPAAHAGTDSGTEQQFKTSLAEWMDIKGGDQLAVEDDTMIEQLFQSAIDSRRVQLDIESLNNLPRQLVMGQMMLETQLREQEERQEPIQHT